MITLLVQTERILQNARTLQKQVGKTPMIPVLEANAYGLGDAAVAQLLANEGIQTLAVSRLEEAVRIAGAVRGIDILLLTPYAGEEDTRTILENDLVAAVGSNDSAVLLSSLSRKLHRRARIQLCFDFGMGRFGFSPQDAAKAAQTVKHLGNLELTGVFTILPAGSAEKSSRREQHVKDFNRVLAAVGREELTPGFAHMADVNQLALCPEMRLSAVRVGPELFGRGQPLPGARKERRIPGGRGGLKKVGRAVSEVCDIKWLTAGSTVGDDGRCKVKRATRVAVVPVGLADGLFPEEPGRRGLFRRKLTCEINGRRLPIIGRVGLTALTVDVTDADCAPGDIVSFEVDPVGISAFARREYV